ncbi:hypothetical protein J4468_02655 [Candidatus Woesearchaeota archaeon]|nr:hypothetical protein [Candidatus Woesearchaeota archaeon]
MKRGFTLIFLAILVLSTSVLAANETFEVQRSYDWLLAQGKSSGSFGDIIDTSLSYLALKSAGETVKTGLAIDFLKSQQNVIQKCLPRTNCKVIDTAVTALAFQKEGEETVEIDDWFKKAQSAALVSGKWYLQIIATGTGNCSISYLNIQSNQTKTFYASFIDGNLTNRCAYKKWLDIDKCFESGLIAGNPFLTLKVDCSDLGASHLTILYNTENSYYIIADEASSSAELHIQNGCFGIGFKDSCDYRSSLYANWALKVIGSETNTISYLTSNYDKTDPFNSAMMFIITGKEQYLTDLTASIGTDGSFANKNIFTTSTAYYANKFDNTKSWIETKVRPDGSWNGNVKDTAMTLFAAYPDASIEFPTCTDGIKNGLETDVDCGGGCPSCEGQTFICDKDGTCDADQGEDYTNCPTDCTSPAIPDHCSNGDIDSDLGEEGIDCGGPCLRSCNDQCIMDIDCELEGKNYCYLGSCVDCRDDSDCNPGYECDYNNDCSLISSIVECGDGICEDNEDSTTCPDDCPTDSPKESNLTWIYVLLVILLVGLIAVYFLVIKKPGNRPERTGFKAGPVKGFQFSPIGKGPGSEINNLDKSIKEAENILKRK